VLGVPATVPGMPRAAVVLGDLSLAWPEECVPAEPEPSLLPAPVPQRIGKTREENAVEEGTEAATPGLDLLLGPVLPDRFHDPQHGVLLGVHLVGLLQAAVGGVPPDEPIFQAVAPADQLIPGRDVAALLGQNDELFVL